MPEKIERLKPGEFIQNSDGSRSTERSVTVQHPRLNGGRPTNIPTIWKLNGEIVELPFENEDMVVDFALRSGEKWKAFKSIDEAVQAAIERSKKGGRFQDK